MNLTPKQKAFCDYYIQSCNATESAIKAGYNKKTARQMGSMNLTKVDIKNYINERIKQLEDERIAKADEVLKYLTAALRGEIKEEVVVVEGEGDGCSSARTIKKEIGARERIKAAELLGKRYRLFADRVELEGSVPVQIVDDIDE